MIQAANLAGFVSAHAVQTVANGEPVVPLYAYQHPQQGRAMLRLVSEDPIALGDQHLEENPHQAECAVFICDAMIEVETREKLDALIVELRSYGDTEGTFVLAVPYIPNSSDVAFSLREPRLIEASDHLDPRVSDIFRAFYRGVESHPKGLTFWAEPLGQLG